MCLSELEVISLTEGSPGLDAEQVKVRGRGGQFSPGASGSDTAQAECHPLSFSTRRVHLDVEVRSQELLAPALLCHKEPARASEAPY